MGANCSSNNSIDPEADMNKLCRLITYEHWQSAINRCEKFPKEASTIDVEGCTAMHICCYRDAPLDVIEALQEANPDAVKTKDRYGWLPIHIAMYHGMAEKVINQLKDYYPDGLNDENETGREKFHEEYSLANSRHTDETFEGSTNGNHNGSKMSIVRKSSNFDNVDLSDFLPEKAKIENKDGWLPIHQACYKNVDVSVIKSLHAAYKKGITKSDNHGWIPLHLACYHKSSLEVINFLLETYPKGAGSLNEFKCLPIHLACEAGAEADVLKALCQTFPDGLYKKNMWNNLPIHRAVHQNMSAEGIQVLKDACPNSLSLVNGDGDTPIDIARKVEGLKNREEIIRVLSS